MSDYKKKQNTSHRNNGTGTYPAAKTGLSSRILGSKPSVAKRITVQDDLWRFKLLWLGTIFIFILLIGKALKTQIIDHATYQARIDAKVIKTEVIKAHRGIITDRNDVPLAISTPLSSIWFFPKQYFKLLSEQDKNLQALAKKPHDKALKRQISHKNFDLNQLAQALNMQPEVLKAKIYKYRDKWEIELVRELPPAKAEEIILKNFAALEQRKEFKRYYPQAEPNAQLLGFVSREQKGLEGLERQLNETLAGQDGLVKVMRDRRGNSIKTISQVKQDIQGETIHLSIDSRLQYLTYRALATAGVQHKARSASAVAVDVETGEVLAISNWPSYNSNDLKALPSTENMRNRSVIDMFEPGSTMKPLTVAAALESKLFTQQSMINTSPGFLNIGRFTIRDHGNYGLISIGDVIVKSSNVGVVRITQKLPKEALPTFFKRLGLGSQTALHFPGESRGRIPSLKRLGPTEVATMSYGYGVSTTLVQLVSAYATLGGGGIHRPLTLLRTTTPPQGEQVIAPQLAQQVVEMMEGVVSSRGTAPLAAVPGYRVAGKTGTAHKLAKDGKSYAKNEYRALFVGIAPVSKPKIAVAVVVENPEGDYFGGKVAAPIFATIMQEALRLNNVPLDKPFETLAPSQPNPLATVAPH